MRTLYEKRFKKLEDANLALHKTTRKLQMRIYWLLLILSIVGISVLIEEIF